jgi:sporulation integral membrane protein YlbJ
VQLRWFHTRSRAFTLLLGLIAAALVVSIIAYPEQAFQASLKGLRLWWDWVFPALLPFLIITELLLGFGIIHGLGIMLEPLMRRLFRLPGSGGWALAAGAVVGYPLGADATAKLRLRGDISGPDADRLAALSHLCNPMLIVGVVGAGFLHSPEAGLILALLHYAGAFAAGVLLRFTQKKPASSSREEAVPGGGRGSLLYRAARSMELARSQDGRVFGKLLGDAVSQSIQALMMVGGLMMIFSVSIRLAGILLGESPAAVWVLRVLPGILEPHLGAFAYSQMQGVPPALQAAAISACLAWSGFSLHAQVLAFAKDTGIRYLPFLRFRVVHSLIAAGLTALLWNPLGRLLQGAEAAFSPAGGWRLVPDGYPEGLHLRELGAMWGASFTLLGLLLASMLVLSLTIRLLERTAGARRPR